MDKKQRDLLYRSFDDALTPKEDAQLEQALAESKSLRKEKERITALRNAVSSKAARSFEPYFADRVMQRIVQTTKKERGRETYFDALFSVFRPVVVGAIILIIVLLSYNIIRSDRVSLAGAFAEPQVTLEEAYDPSLMLSMENMR